MTQTASRLVAVFALATFAAMGCGSSDSSESEATEAPPATETSTTTAETPTITEAPTTSPTPTTTPLHEGETETLAAITASAPDGLLMGVTPEAAAIPGATEQFFAGAAGDNRVETTVLFFDDGPADGQSWLTWSDADPASPNFGLTFYGSVLGNPIDGTTAVLVGGPDATAISMFLMMYGLS